MTSDISSELGTRLPAPWSRTFIWLGRSLLGLMLIVIVGSLGLLATVKSLNKSASAYVDTSVRAITSPWDAQAFLQRALPEVLPPDAQHSVPKSFEHFAVLGNLKTLKAPTGRIGHGAFPGTPILGFWADYRVAAEFEHGPAQLLMVLARTEDGWRIAALEISSPLFAPK